MTDRDYWELKKASSVEGLNVPVYKEVKKTKGKIRSVMFAILMTFLVSSYVVEGNVHLLPTLNTVFFVSLILLFIFLYWFLNKKPKQIPK